MCWDCLGTDEQVTQTRTMVAFVTVLHSKLRGLQQRVLLLSLCTGVSAEQWHLCTGVQAATVKCKLSLNQLIQCSASTTFFRPFLVACAVCIEQLPNTCNRHIRLHLCAVQARLLGEPVQCGESRAC